MIVSHKNYGVDVIGNQRYLLQDDKSYYQVIVMKIGEHWYDGLNNPLLEEYEDYCTRYIGGRKRNRSNTAEIYLSN